MTIFSRIWIAPGIRLREWNSACQCDSSALSLQDGFEALLPFDGGEGVGRHDRHQVRSDRQQRPESGRLVQTGRGRQVDDVSVAVCEELADTATGRPTGSGRRVDLSAAAVARPERAVFRRCSVRVFEGSGRETSAVAFGDRPDVLEGRARHSHLTFPVNGGGHTGSLATGQGPRALFDILHGGERADDAISLIVSAPRTRAPGEFYHTRTAERAMWLTWLAIGWCRDRNSLTGRSAADFGTWMRSTRGTRASLPCEFPPGARRRIPAPSCRHYPRRAWLCDDRSGRYWPRHWEQRAEFALRRPPPLVSAAGVRHCEVPDHGGRFAWG